MGKKLFNAEISKGFIIKVLVDSLVATSLQRGFFTLDDRGIFLRQIDQGNTILYDVELLRKNLKNYVCTRPRTISVNLKHMQGLLKNVKKKDSISIYIDSEKSNNLTVCIKQDKDNNREEINRIAFQEEDSYVTLDLPEGTYDYPMVISATDFQKIKRLTSISKTIIVTIQNNNYLSFNADAGIIYDSELKFGELIEDNKDEDEEEEDEVDIEIEEGTEDEASWYVCTKEQNNSVFKTSYYSAILNKLIKLPGLCNQMQFYAPKVPHFPLKIEASAGQGGYTLGNISIYIKDVGQLVYEASIHSANM
jgi:hypothetical protein